MWSSLNEVGDRRCRYTLNRSHCSLGGTPLISYKAERFASTEIKLIHPFPSIWLINNLDEFLYHVITMMQETAWISFPEIHQSGNFPIWVNFILVSVKFSQKLVRKQTKNVPLERFLNSRFRAEPLQERLSLSLDWELDAVKFRLGVRIEVELTPETNSTKKCHTSICQRSKCYFASPPAPRKNEITSSTEYHPLKFNASISLNIRTITCNTWKYHRLTVKLKDESEGTVLK